MRRKLQTVGWITTLFCCAVLWATPAMAEEYLIWIGGVQVTSENCNYIDYRQGARFPCREGGLAALHA